MLDVTDPEVLGRLARDAARCDPNPLLRFFQHGAVGHASVAACHDETAKDLISIDYLNVYPNDAQYLLRPSY